jgi:phosphatidylinositol alpha-mannosyltransferase
MSAATPAGDGLRVAMVCPYSLSRPGGVQGQATGLARALRRRGHRVAVLAPTDGRTQDFLEDPETDAAGGIGGQLTVPIGRALGMRSNGSVAPVALSPLAADRVERFVRRNRIDVVHLHEPLAPAAGYGVLLRHPAPVVATFHRSGGSAWYRALSPAVRRARARIDVACAVSEAARRTAADALGGDYDVLFNGVDVEHFAMASPRTSDGRPTVLFVGRHEDRKGLGVLLDAFGRMGEGQLWIAGGGPRTADLRRHHPPSDRLRWLGLLTEEEKAAAVAGADVLCAPSLRGESFGVVLLEGMAGRCVVVASDIDGYREAAGGHAELVPPGDPAALAGALQRALRDVVGRSGAAAAAALDDASAYAGRWSMHALAAAYEDRYRIAVAASPR